MFWLGLGVAQDAKAKPDVRWLEKAADKGYSLAMQQHTEVAPQIFSFVESESLALFKAGKNDLKTLLDAPGKHLRSAVCSSCT